MWINSNHTVLFCKDCIQKMFAELSKRYNSEQTALMICCHYLDVPFYASLYKSITENNNFFNVGLYLRQLQMKQYQYQDFSTCLMNGELTKTDDEVKKEIEEKWSKSDKQNMNFAISIVGYDPFDNCGMTDNDRKYCFNILAGYCDSEGIQEDGHKIQSVVQITQSQLQCRKLDEFINAELLSVHPDDKRVKELTSTKKSLLDSIAKIAQDNNLSSNYNANSKQGASTLTKKMKDIAKNGIDEIKVNLFDMKTASAMRQIADLSNASILSQWNPGSDENAKMLKEQREMIHKYENYTDKIEEENRNLKIKLQDYELKKKR